jgi:hypothetical protein
LPTLPYQKLCVLLFFAALLLLGVAIHRDYGFSFDEGAQRIIGAVTIRYLVEQFAPSQLPAALAALPPLDQFRDKDYGVAFEAPAVMLEAVLGLTDKRDIFFLRHLLTFLVSLGGAFAVYSLAYRRFASRGLGALAVAFLLLSPRLFADSFYNSKDAVFMAAVAIAMNTMIAFVLRPRPVAAVLHALATAFAIDVRIAGILLLAVTFVLLAVQAVKREETWRACASGLATYALASALFTVMMWPWLWADPFGRFAQAVTSMSKFSRWDGPVLYRGDFVRSTELPWHYAPIWISITTPLLYLLAFGVGAVATCRRLMKARLGLWRSDAELQDLVFLGLAVAPVASAILSHAVLYDGWRHLYFIYPAFLLVAVRGWQVLANGAVLPRFRRGAMVLATAASLTLTAAWMWRAHPYQNVYFNFLAGSNLRAQYELDYWGLSTRRGLEYVLSRDPCDPIRVMAGSFLTLDTSAYLLPPEDRERVRITTDKSLPHYLFTNYRMEKDKDDQKYLAEYEPFYQINVDGEVILSVFKSRAVDETGREGRCPR